MSDQSTIRSIHMAPIVAKPHSPSWDAVLRQDMADARNGLVFELLALFKVLNQNVADHKAEATTALNQHALNTKTVLVSDAEQLAAILKAEYDRVENDLSVRLRDFEERIAAAHARVAVLESRWYNRVHNWLCKVFRCQ